MTTAKFTINATAAALRGYDALNSEALSFQLEDSPALDVLACVYSVVIASYGAPALTLSGSGVASPPTAAVTTSAPSSGAHSYIIRCTITTDQGTQTYERLVCTRVLGARKIAPGETIQHDPTYGWTKAWSDLIDSYVAALAATEKPAVKLPVRVATTGAVAHAGLLTIDSVVLLAGDRVLDKDHGTASLRGVWVADAGAWTRATDFDSSDEVFAGVIVPVTEGTLSQDTIWILTTDGAITVGSTSLAFTNITVPAGLGADAVVETTGGGQLTATANTKGVSAATASTYVKRDVSGGAAFDWLSTGASPSPSGDLRVPTTFSLLSGPSAHPVVSAAPTVAIFGSVTRDTNIEGVDISIYSDASGAQITSTASNELAIAVPSGVFDVDAHTAEMTTSVGGITCTGAAASTFGCTTGALIIATADNASAATMSAGTAGNAVSVEANANSDAITCTVNGTAALALSTTAATLGVASLTWTEGLAPTVQQAIRTGDNAANALILASQTPSTTSTGANRDAKRVRIQIPAPQGAGAESYVGFEISGTERAQVNRYSAVFNDGNSGKAVRIGAYYPAGAPGTTYAAIYFGTGATSPNSTTYGFLGDSADTYLNAPTGTLYLMKAGAVHTTLTEAGSAYTITLGPTVSLLLTAAATTAAITANKAQALTISIGTQTTDAAPQTITFTPGQPWASATGANRKPGDVVTALGAPTSSGTTHAAVRVTRGASSLILEDKGEVTTADATATVVYSYTLADTTAVHLRARMVSFRTDSGTNCNVDVLEAGCKRRGGGATLVGAVTTTLKEDAAFTSFTATVSGNDLRVEVQARGGETWKHRVHVEIVAEVIT